MKSPYDFIVLGAGAAGCVAARLLAERYPGASVALLEQGGTGRLPTVARVPFLQPFIATSRRAKPFLRTINAVPEDNLGGRALTYLRGCGLGGSTLCNDMTYMRGTRADIAAWGDSEWSFDTLLPHFTQLEANTRSSSPGHGTDGFVPVTDLDRSSVDAALNVRFFEACEAAGVPATDDFNLGVTSGFSAYQSLVHRGSRADVFQHCVTNHAHRLPHLEVFTQTRATRLVFSPNSTVVSGVEVVRGGSERTVIHSPHVMVCLGAVDSAALLQRSGVCEHGTVLDSPAVGKGLIQGCSVDLVFRVLNNMNVCSKSMSWRNSPYMWQQWREYVEDRTGVFASFAEAAAYVQSSTQGTGDADMSIAFLRSPQVGARAWRRAVALDGFTLRITHHYPESRGEITLGQDAQQSALVRSNMVSTKHDVQCMDEGVQWAGLLVPRGSNLRSVYHQDEKGAAVGPFWSYNPVPHHPRGGLQSAKDVAAFLAEYAESSGDLFGTCALGAVVDSKLRVKGVEGVVVADASVVPAPTVASSAVLGAAIASCAVSFLT